MRFPSSTNAIGPRFTHPRVIAYLLFIIIDDPSKRNFNYTQKKCRKEWGRRERKGKCFWDEENGK